MRSKIETPIEENKQEHESDRSDEDEIVKEDPLLKIKREQEL
jgi:hypothetical protein